MTDLGLAVHKKACGTSLVKKGDQAVCPVCGATFSAARMIRAIAAGQVRVAPSWNEVKGGRVLMPCVGNVRGCNGLVKVRFSFGLVDYSCDHEPVAIEGVPK